MCKKNLLVKALIALTIVSIALSACGSQAPAIDKPGQPEGLVTGIFVYDKSDGHWQLTVIPDPRLKILDEPYVILQEQGFGRITLDDGDSSWEQGSRYSHNLVRNGYFFEGILDSPLKFLDNREIRLSFVVDDSNKECDWEVVYPNKKDFPTNPSTYTFECHLPLPTE